MIHTTDRETEFQRDDKQFEQEFLKVVYQDGLPQDVGVNGCRVDDVIFEAVDRLQFYQRGPLACDENIRAIRHLEAALIALRERTVRRHEQGVLNTYIRHETARTEDEDQDFSATGA